MPRGEEILKDLAGRVRWVAMKRAVPGKIELQGVSHFSVEKSLYRSLK
jgi:hypothetical protein